jgi:polyisoprenoid-binding protein YceI
METMEQTGQATWKIDADHSEVGFSVRHMMISTVRGRFTSFDVQLQLDEADVAGSRISARIDAASVDTRSEQRDAHLRSADFFDADNHPQLVFESREVRSVGDDRYEVAGDLTIRGITRPVVLSVKEEGRGEDPWGGQRVAYTAEARVDRKDFGLTWNQALEAGGVLVSEEVKITLEVQVVRG